MICNLEQLLFRKMLVYGSSFKQLIQSALFEDKYCLQLSETKKHLCMLVIILIQFYITVPTLYLFEATTKTLFSLDSLC